MIIFMIIQLIGLDSDVEENYLLKSLKRWICNEGTVLMVPYWKQKQMIILKFTEGHLILLGLNLKALFSKEVIPSSSRIMCPPFLKELQEQTRIFGKWAA